MIISRPVYKHFMTDEMEVVVQGERSIVFDKARNKYYQIPTTGVPADIIEKTVYRNTLVTPLFAYAFVIAGIFLLIANLAISMTQNAALSYQFIWFFVPYILFSVVLHEGAHIVALRMMGRDYDKLGFKLHYFILPAFYVRMNQSILLSKYEKMVVHGSGIVVNLFTNMCLFILNLLVFNSSEVYSSVIFATVTLAYNAVPMLNSDGYRVLLAVADINERKKHGNNKLWIRVIKTVSWVVVMLYGIGIVLESLRGVIL